MVLASHRRMTQPWHGASWGDDRLFPQIVAQVQAATATAKVRLVLPAGILKRQVQRVRFLPTRGRWASVPDHASGVGKRF
jgi:hypothetical protein